ncbi:hypothetical protein RclHR1_21280001 [Rhizophagus clarus]|uniref:HAT C-terminal dimerisation domain-containing protein n=1 Tax=Rhizophagus clarus TaxID=94130 RepID=A0A2Z6QUF8_9GLOM|nr:hypothetical protein RclHR1_21280001 [Rhizophagus clarus]
MKLLYLQGLAIKLFSVSPHAANCERIWSICGWIHGIQKSEKEIQQILKDTNLYEEEERITLEEVMTKINLEQTAIDDDSKTIDDKPLELEEALDLTNSQFL